MKLLFYFTILLICLPQKIFALGNFDHQFFNKYVLELKDKVLYESPRSILFRIKEENRYSFVYCGTLSDLPLKLPERGECTPLTIEWQNFQGQEDMENKSKWVLINFTRRHVDVDCMVAADIFDDIRRVYPQHKNFELLSIEKRLMSYLVLIRKERVKLFFLEVDRCLK